MSAATTLFQLVSDPNGMFDGSVNGISILKTVNAKILPGDAGIALTKGAVDIARHRDLDALQSFTIEATITPKTVGSVRQNIVEGKTPSIALFIESNGKLVGSIHTAAGWVTVDSGTTLVRAGAAQRVTFTRDASGNNQLAIDGRTVGTRSVQGPIQNVGALGFRIGIGMDGTNFPFTGTVKDLSIRQGVVTQQTLDQQAQIAARLEAKVKQAGVIKNITVSLVPDASHARLQHVKDIMNAAGVQTLSDLDTLPVKTRTPLSRGQVLVAPKKAATVKVNWVDIAKQFRAGDAAAQRNILAAHLTNQNSAAFLRSLPTEKLAPQRAGAPTALAAAPGALALRPSSGPAPALPRIPEKTIHTSETLRLASDKVVAIDAGLLQNLTSTKPSLWPTTSSAQFQVMELQTVPIDSAVVIAGTLDLTNEQLVVEPNVGTLYIIAETLICGNNAAITWRRPGGATPGRADNPDLNGRSFPGVQTKSGSRDGLDGGDGLPGQAGVVAANGRTAPNIEIWVKNMTGLPNLDFNGESGIVGGQGQRGGRGGNGGDGHLGERWWLFGWHCSSEGGDGGDGGNGGRGGDGARGGNGGNAGAISIGVLTGTLENTVVNKSFKVKNQGGRRANGGAGGPGGAGGSGGRSGNGDTCHGSKNG